MKRLAKSEIQRFFLIFFVSIGVVTFGQMCFFLGQQNTSEKKIYFRFSSLDDQLNLKDSLVNQKSGSIELSEGSKIDGVENFEEEGEVTEAPTLISAETEKLIHKPKSQVIEMQKPKPPAQEDSTYETFQFPEPVHHEKPVTKTTEEPKKSEENPSPEPTKSSAEKTTTTTKAPKIEYYPPEPKRPSNEDLPYCYEVMELKGRKIKINGLEANGKADITYETLVAKLDPEIEDGCYTPKDCIPDQHLNIIVPYRDREQHLHYFLLFMHRMLKNQKRSYCIIIAEQADFGQFNRAKLLNVGYLEAKKHRHWTEKVKKIPDCYGFHDVDMIPDDDNNLYMCHPEKAIHIDDKYNKYSYKTQYAAGHHVGLSGAALIPALQYEKVNGHPNWYWGWGVEDIAMGGRLRNNPANITGGDMDIYFPDKADQDKLAIGAFRSNYFSKGLTEEGGGPGLTRQDIYGLYTQMSHIHGFTNGPNKIRTTHENGNWVAKYQIGVFRSERDKLKWDGVDQTTYKINSVTYDKFYTKYNTEIRPSVTTHLKVILQGHTAIDIVPSEYSVDDCRFVKLTNVIARNDDPNIEKYGYFNYKTEDKIKTGLEKCYNMNAHHGQCNMFSTIDFWIPKILPLPLKSKPAEKDNSKGSYDTFVRHCPAVLGWFQVAEKDAVLETKNSNLKPAPFLYQLKIELDLQETPIKGGLFYADYLIFEGNRHSGRWLDLEQIPEVGGKTVKKDIEEGLTVDLRRFEENKLVVSISIKFEKFVPGVGLFNHRFLDYFGQLYFDANFVFKVVGDTESEKDDEQMRNKYLDDLSRESTDEFRFMDIQDMRKELKQKIKEFYNVTEGVEQK